ncbi:hypothetical protein BCV70DRAFT_68379 [Testicularia cyperi]|uniref:Uncharacterized protein n=1 Tax=Testicularia cyperi TaxID=1882483 RepID=A0A317XJ53_9BASI|nr:hypothetical protein BCV70DRAFT_68379 [Testicularia cyperi]
MGGAEKTATVAGDPEAKFVSACMCVWVWVCVSVIVRACEACRSACVFLQHSRVRYVSVSVDGASEGCVSRPRQPLPDSWALD